MSPLRAWKSNRCLTDPDLTYSGEAIAFPLVSKYGQWTRWRRDSIVRRYESRAQSSCPFRAPRDDRDVLQGARIWASRGPRWAAKKGSKVVSEANKRTTEKCV